MLHEVYNARRFFITCYVTDYTCHHNGRYAFYMVTIHMYIYFTWLPYICIYILHGYHTYVYTFYMVTIHMYIYFTWLPYICIYILHGYHTYVYTFYMVTIHMYIHFTWLPYICIYILHGYHAYVYTFYMVTIHMYIHFTWLPYICIYIFSCVSEFHWSHLRCKWDDMHFAWFSMWDGFLSPRVAESHPGRLRRG